MVHGKLYGKNCDERCILGKKGNDEISFILVPLGFGLPAQAAEEEKF